MGAGVLVDWQPWFAWYPVRLQPSEGSRIVWWRRISRRYSMALDYASWDYSLARKAVAK
jgi:hypothetical protein